MGYRWLQEGSKVSADFGEKMQKKLYLYKNALLIFISGLFTLSKDNNQMINNKNNNRK